MSRTHLDRRGPYREPKTTLRSHRQHTTTHSASHALQGTHIIMMPRWQRCILRPSQGYTDHWRADYTPPDISSATQLSRLLQTATNIRVRKASPDSARHRHAVNRGGIIDAGRARQPRASRDEGMLAHVAACHRQTRHSRLGGGRDALLERRWCAAASMKSRSRRPMRGRQCAGEMAGGAQSAALVARSAWWRRRLAGEAAAACGSELYTLRCKAKGAWGGPF